MGNCCATRYVNPLTHLPGSVQDGDSVADLGEFEINSEPQREIVSSKDVPESNNEEEITTQAQPKNIASPVSSPAPREAVESDNTIPEEILTQAQPKAPDIPVESPDIPAKSPTPQEAHQPENSGIVEVKSDITLPAETTDPEPAGETGGGKEATAPDSRTPATDTSDVVSEPEEKSQVPSETITAPADDAHDKDASSVDSDPEAKSQASNGDIVPELKSFNKKLPSFMGGGGGMIDLSLSSSRKDRLRSRSLMVSSTGSLVQPKLLARKSIIEEKKKPSRRASVSTAVKGFSVSTGSLKMEALAKVNKMSSWQLFLNDSYHWCMYKLDNGLDGEEVLFADKLIKINSRGSRQKRLFALTNKALYNMTERVQGVTVKRRVAFDKLMKISRSWKSRQFVIHVPSEYDYWFEAERREDIILILKKHAPHIKIIESYDRSLGSLVQTKKDNVHTEAKALLPECPRLEFNVDLKPEDLAGKRERAVLELVTSEEKYCQFLSNFLEFNAYPLDVHRNKASIMKNRDKWLELFDNLENIVRFHTVYFCPELQKAITQGKDMGQSFTRRLDTLIKVYTPYLQGWSKLRAKVDRLLSKQKYSKYFTRQQNLHQGMGINAFLIMPIQRIPRYILLINEIIKQSDPNDEELQEDTKSLKMALEEVKRVAKLANENLK